MKHREMAMGILKWTCQKILINWIWNHVLNISSPTKKSTDYMTYTIRHGPPQSPHRYTTNVAPRINSFKMASLEYLSSAQFGGHGSTTQNLRQSLGVHTFPVSKSSAPLTKTIQDLGKSRPKLRKKQKHLAA